MVNKDTLVFFSYVVIVFALIFVGISVAVTVVINRQSEIIVERTFIVESTITARDLLFNFEYTTVGLYPSDSKSDYLHFWDKVDFEAWHRYKVSYHAEWQYLSFNKRIIDLEDLGEFPIPTPKQTTGEK